MNILRPYYMRQSIDAKNNGLIKIVSGIRRAGKFLSAGWTGYIMMHPKQVTKIVENTERIDSLKAIQQTQEQNLEMLRRKNDSLLQNLNEMQDNEIRLRKEFQRSQMDLFNLYQETNSILPVRSAGQSPENQRY